MVDLETLGRIARMAIIHIDDRGNLAPVTPLLLQIIFIVHHMLIQPNYKRSEIQELVANTISYVKISHAHLPFSAIREYLTSLLSKAIYSQYLSRQSRESDTQRVEERTKPAYSGKHEHPSSAVEEVIQVLRNGWADLGETWSEDHPDMKIRNEVRELLLAVQEYKFWDENSPTAKIREDVNKLFLAVINQTDQFVFQTRSLLT